MDTLARRWTLALAAAAIVGVLAWLSNITTGAQLLGEDRALWGVRTFVSRVANSGTVWAGLPVLAGWLVRRPLQGTLAGVLVSEAALVIHYVLGTATGTMPWVSWADNWYWFVAAVVLCAPLGLVGSLARRTDWWGLAARLVVPLGAICEPLLSRMLDPGFTVDRADHLASVAAGIVLLACGAAGLVVVLWRLRTDRHDHSAKGCAHRIR